MGDASCARGCLACVPGSCKPVAASHLMDHPPRRELDAAGGAPLSTYRRLWRDATPWAVFLAPGWREGPGPAPDPRPGVYEFALSARGADATRVVVYVGKSSSVRARHAAYARGGDHLADLIGPALDAGLTLWRRVRYLPDDLAAQRWEAACLIEFDYAWNRDLNPPKRALELERAACCCATVAVRVSEPGGGARRDVPAAGARCAAAAAVALSLACQGALAVAIIVTVAAGLHTVQLSSGDASQTSATCLLGTSDQGHSLCVYAYVASGVGLAAALAVAAVMACAHRGCCALWDAAASAAAAAWWALAALVLTASARKADVAALPRAPARDAVCAMAWVEAALCALVVAQRAALAACACCASGDGGARWEEPPTAPPAPWEAAASASSSGQFVVGEMR